eukprot:5104034-Pleurochrysis_carterae.AAC.2
MARQALAYVDIAAVAQSAVRLRACNVTHAQPLAIFEPSQPTFLRVQSKYTPCLCGLVFLRLPTLLIRRTRRSVGLAR